MDKKVSDPDSTANLPLSSGLSFLMSQPDLMRCIEISTPGDPDVLRLATRTIPTLNAGQVLVKVDYAGVNRPDVLQREGKYPPPPDASDIPGLEVSGTVVATGPDVSWPLPGTSVAALVAGGGYAEYAVADSTLCLPVAGTLKAEEAAALPEALFTVFHNVLERGQLRPGEVFLVHGGASGIGTTAIQVARSIGAMVYATAGSEDKCATCLRLGADLAINWRNEDYTAVIKKAGRGVDVILDMAGGERIQKDIRLMNPDGRHINIAFLEGSRVELDLMPVMLKRLTLSGSTLRSQSTTAKARMAETIRQQLWPRVLKGDIRPLLHSTFPLEQAANAHRLMESRTHEGKIVLSNNLR